VALADRLESPVVSDTMPTWLARRQTVLCFQGVVGLEVTALNIPVPLA